MQSHYYIYHGEEQVGPFSVEEIASSILEGRLTPMDLIFVEAQQEWIALSKAEDFHFLFGDYHADNVIPFPQETAQEVKSLDFEIPDFSALIATPHQSKEVELGSGPNQVESYENKENETEDFSHMDEKMIETMISETYDSSAEDPSGPVGEDKSSHEVMVENGLGEIVLTHTRCEDIVIQVEGFEESVFPDQVIHVLPSEIHMLRVTSSDTQCTVGQDVSFNIEALDEYGNRVIGLTHIVQVKTTGSAQHAGSASLVDGCGSFTLHNTVAELNQIEFSIVNEAGERIAESMEFKFNPGPATRFALNTPDDVKAGQPIRVKVIALDQFGNQVLNFSEPVKLKIRPVI